MTRGFGLRWAQMGLFETFRVAGGPGGFRHFLAQFGPALELPWTKLSDVPDLDDQLIDTIVSQSDAQATADRDGGGTARGPDGHDGDDLRDAERRRDRNLVAILRALETEQQGAGRDVAAMRSALAARVDG